MRPVSATFLATLRSAHVVALDAQLEVPGVAPFAVPVLGGSVTLDAHASNRRTGSIEIGWPITFEKVVGGTTIDLRELPFGSYVRLRRGVRYGDGSTELVALGRLRVESLSWETVAAQASAELGVSLELADGMAQVHDEPLSVPYAAGGKTAAAAVIELVTAVHGASIAYHNLMPTGPVLADVTYTGDRDKAVHDLAASVGGEAYFDAAGDFVLAPLPTSTTPVWTVDEGPTGVLIGADETLDRTETVNGVLVRGQADAASPPVAALVTDTDPASPTRYGGPFGKVVLVIESTAVQTVQQATDAATAELDPRLGLARNLTLHAVPNPALEPNDVVSVVFPDGRTETHRLETITVPFDARGEVQAGSRSAFRPTGMLAELRNTRRRRGVYVNDDAYREARDARKVPA